MTFPGIPELWEKYGVHAKPITMFVLINIIWTKIGIVKKHLLFVIIFTNIDWVKTTQAGEPLYLTSTLLMIIANENPRCMT